MVLVNQNLEILLSNLMQEDQLHSEEHLNVLGVWIVHANKDQEIQVFVVLSALCHNLISVILVNIHMLDHAMLTQAMFKVGREALN